MQVLYQLVRNKSTRLGGGTHRLRRTKEQLEKQGVRVRVTESLRPNLRGIDVVHLWQSQDPDCFRHAAYVRAAGVPYVISTIFIDMDRFGFWNEASAGWRMVGKVVGPDRALVAFRRWTDRRVRGTQRWKQERAVLDGATVLLPTSRREAAFIRRRFRIGVPNVIVANAVDVEFFRKGNAARFAKRVGGLGFIFSAGRIEPVKNQLGLVRALAGTGDRLVLAGDRPASTAAYRRRCLAEAKQLGVPVQDVGLLSADELRDAYAAAKAHVLPSWHETTGQVTLQAAAAGCPAVHTADSPWQEYVPQGVAICRPESPASIRVAIDEAVGYSERTREQLRKRTRAFSWQRTARDTLRGYRKAVDTHG